MLKPDHADKKGVDRYQGYAIDLLFALAEEEKFTFDLLIESDRTYGSRGPDGRWNGVVELLLNGVIFVLFYGNTNSI